MRQRAGLVVVLAFIGVMVGFGRAVADDEPDHHEAEAEHHEAPPAEEAAPHEAEHHEAPAADEPAPQAEVADEGDSDDSDGPAVAYNKFDLDGDGTADPVIEQEYADAMAGIPAT